MDLATTKAALALLEKGEGFALVSTLETAGSSPRHSGAAMIVERDGAIAGTVGGGSLEAHAIRAALEVLGARGARVMEFELTNADSAGLGMICGGRGRLLIESVDSSAAATRTMLTALGDLLAAGGSGWLVTRVTVGAGSADLGVERCLVDASGTVAGGTPCSIAELQSLAKMGGALDGHTAGDRPGVYVQPVGVPGTAYVFGAGHCGKSLVPLLGLVGFRTAIVDDRSDFANRERFPDADSILVPESFEKAFEQLAIDEQSYLVIMTRGHMFDRTVLAQALRTSAGYVGMIGSRKKIAQTFRTLRDQGFTDDDLARVHAPIGLSIGAETPEEIAVSIVAEIIQVRAGTARRS